MLRDNNLQSRYSDSMEPLMVIQLLKILPGLLAWEFDGFG